MGTVRPPNAVHPGEAAVLVAVLSRPRPTVTTVVADTGLVRSTAFRYLRRLRRNGWVTWEDGRLGTLRATCSEVRL